MDLTELLKKLSNAQGLSGYEEPVREIIREAMLPYVDEVQLNRLGSLIGLRRGSGRPPRRKVMLAAHMDEIGLMVTGIDKGFLRITRVGGTDERVLLGQEIIVHGRADLPGVIGSRPPHVLPANQRDKVIAMDNLFADVGLPADQIEKWVRVGDLISFRREANCLAGDFLSGKALDDRASVAAVIACLDGLASRQAQWDVLAVATIQEETRLLGAATTAYELKPDVAIAIDVTFGAQNGVPESRTFGMGKGPTIGSGPNMHPAITQRLIDTAKRLEISYQLEATPGASGTDGWAIQVACEGIPTGVMGIPLRYMHTPVETVAIKDVERTGRLLADFICSLDEAFVETLCAMD